VSGMKKTPRRTYGVFHRSSGSARLAPRWPDPWSTPLCRPRVHFANSRDLRPTRSVRVRRLLAPDHRPRQRFDQEHLIMLDALNAPPPRDHRGDRSGLPPAGQESTRREPSRPRLMADLFTQRADRIITSTCTPTSSMASASCPRRPPEWRCRSWRTKSRIGDHQLRRGLSGCRPHPVASAGPSVSVAVRLPSCHKTRHRPPQRNVAQPLSSVTSMGLMCVLTDDLIDTAARS